MFTLLVPWLPVLGGGSSGLSLPVLPSEDPRPVFGWPFYSDAGVLYSPVLSGGAWEPTLPLASLQDRSLSKVARSVGTSTASTQFSVDLGADRNVGLLALPKHNISVGATVRWSAATSAGGFASPVYSSGWLSVWPEYTSVEDVVGLNVSHVHVLPTVTTARYWRCEISNVSNPAGYVQLSRLVIAGAWYPSSGLSVGAKFGLESDTERIVSDGGAAIYRDRPLRRLWDFEVPMLAESESLSLVWKILRGAGASGQVLFVFDVNDPYMHERAFLCVMRELSALDHPYASLHAVAFRLIEEL